MTDPNKITAGTQVYYTGDMTNQDGEGVVAKVIESDRFQDQLVIVLDDGRNLTTTRTGFLPGAGRRWYVLADWNAKRETEMAAFRASYG